MFDIEYGGGWWIAFGRSRPGCCAAATTLDACRGAISTAADDYDNWLHDHGLDVSHDDDAAEDIGEVHLAWTWGPRDYEVSAFFAADRPPLTAEEIARGLRLLAATRADLDAAVADVSPDDLRRVVEDDWSILTILNHISSAENWYLSHVDLALPRSELPGDPVERLARVRAHTEAVLPTLAGDDRLAAVEYEIWSPRKVLRRAVWHERDHTDHVRQFKRRLSA